MKCTHCQADNRPERKFCSACGQPLPLACSRCGFANTPADRFCGGCGAALVDGARPATPVASQPAADEKLVRDIPKDLAAKILATRGTIEGERRQVTILFCDLAASTHIGELLDPETYRELINQYLEASMAEVYRHEGVVNQIAGDGFMAIFGAPIAHDDEASRGCRAALDIRQALSRLALTWKQKLGETLAARIGLNSGQVIVGTVGSDLKMDYTAIGDTTNVASRIQALARPGEIYLSEATRKLVAHYFETAEVGPAALKGKQEQTAVFRLVREIPRRERRHQALRAGLSRFHGRQVELALLGERFEEARVGRGQVVLLSGEAGIGKSRLIYEFRRRLDPSAHTWLEGQCASYGKLASYYPFLDLLRGTFEVEESDSPPAIIDKVARLCAAVAGPVKRAEAIYRDLLSVDPGEKRVETMLESIKFSVYREAFRDLILGLTSERTVILLVEDVHWIDQSSEDLLRRILEAITGARVLVLVTCRPEYKWPYPDRSYFTRISLHGLPSALIDELTESVLGKSDLPRQLKRLIAERSDGNPFFIEELAKSIKEMGVLDKGLPSAALAAQVPSTLHDVIMSRIDRLEGEAKYALQVASVIGREFTLRVLERAKEWSATPAETLGKLSSLELIYEKAVHPDLAYMFKHALTHDVAYGTLLQAQRRDLHKRVAALIEEIYADRLPEFYETLAYQYRQAEIPERAAHYALLAGEHAAAHMAPEATHYFEDAVELAGRHAECADIAIKARAALGDLLLLQGQPDAAIEAYSAALRTAKDDSVTEWLRNKMPRRHFINRDGVRLAHYVHGKGSDDANTTPIVMLYPFIQGSYAFAMFAERICQEHCVVYMDARGFGASDKPKEPYDFDVRVEDAIAVLHELPYRKLTFFADSDGVPMALQVFHRLPERVEKMVLFGGFARVKKAPDYPVGVSEDEWESAVNAFVTDDYRVGVERFNAAAFSEPGMAAWREMMLDNYLQSVDQDLHRGFVESLGAKDVRHLLPGVNVPVLVIAAEEDRLLPVPIVRYLADNIPGAKFALIKGVGHMAPWTAADTVMEMLTTFIKTGTLPRTEWEP